MVAYRTAALGESISYQDGDLRLTNVDDLGWDEDPNGESVFVDLSLEIDVEYFGLPDGALFVMLSEITEVPEGAPIDVGTLSLFNVGSPVDLTLFEQARDQLGGFGVVVTARAVGVSFPPDAEPFVITDTESEPEVEEPWHYRIHPRTPFPGGPPVRVKTEDPDVWEESNPVLKKGEPGYDGTDFKIGDGVTAWNDLGAVSSGGGGGDGGLTEQDIADAFSDDDSPIKAALDSILSDVGGGGGGGTTYFRSVASDPGANDVVSSDVSGGLVVNTLDSGLPAFRVDVTPPSQQSVSTNALDYYNYDTWSLVGIGEGGTTSTGGVVTVEDGRVTMDDGLILYRELLDLNDAELVSAGFSFEADDSLPDVSTGWSNITYGVRGSATGDLTDFGIDGVGTIQFVFPITIPDDASPRMADYSYVGGNLTDYYLPAVTQDQLITAAQNVGTYSSFTDGGLTVDFSDGAVYLVMGTPAPNSAYSNVYYSNESSDQWDRSLTEVGDLIGYEVTDAGQWFNAYGTDESQTLPLTDNGNTIATLYISSKGELSSAFEIVDGDPELNQTNFVRINDPGIYLVTVTAYITEFDFPNTQAESVSASIRLRLAREANFSFTEDAIPEAVYGSSDDTFDAASRNFPKFSSTAAIAVQEGAGLDVSATFAAYTDNFSTPVEDGSVDASFSFYLLKIGNLPEFISA